jgi:alkylated DNA repair dioxygenase AlkB
MANPASLPPSLIAQIQQVAANIPLEHHNMPPDESIVLSVKSAVLHLNDWAFLNGYGYVSSSGLARERRWRYRCVFHSRADSQKTKNSRKTEERDRVRINTYTRGIGCPVSVTITQ